MDTATMSKDYLPELLTNMQSQLNRIEEKTDSLSGDVSDVKLHTQSMYKDIKQAQKDIKALEKTRGMKVHLEPRTLYLISISSVIVLVIVASVLGINVNGLIK
jgi:t-SNARE complex subunit (syntaxin)